MWKYFWSVVAALALTVVALYLYGQSLGSASWTHYAAVTFVSFVVTHFGTAHPKGLGLLVAGIVLVALGVWLVANWSYAVALIWVGLGFLAAAAAVRLPSPKRASVGH